MEENNEKINEVSSEENSTNQGTNAEEAKVGEVVNSEGFSKKDMEDNKVMAVLCYCSFLVLIPYLTEKKSKWVKHHALQGINLFVLEIVATILKIFPVIGGIAFTIGGVFTVLISLMGIINVLNEEDKELPLMDKIKFIKK